MMARPVLIDTDTGVDDALALILALRSRELSVKAITTVAGNVEVGKCTRNALAILHLLGVADKPAVSEGAQKPLCRPLFRAPEVHGTDGLGNARRYILASSTPRKCEQSAAKTIVDHCRSFGNKLVIVALGPLTNLALAWKKNPEAMMKVGRIISMGGAFRVPGNTGPVAEFNYYVDPEAAHLLLNSGLRITIVPLDVTEQIVLMRKELEYRAARRAGRVAKAILRFTKSYMKYHEMTEGFNGGYLHDPLAVAVAIQPDLVQTTRVHVDIETLGRYTRGMSLADFKNKLKRGKPTVEVASKVDRERFLRLFHERIWE